MTYFLRVPPEMKPLLVGILGFDGVTTLDLAGPLEALAAAKVSNAEGAPKHCYETILIGLSSKSFVAESGATFKTHRTLEAAPVLDTVVIPGGIGIRAPEVKAKIVDWLRKGTNPRRIVAVSSGVFPVAASGLLDNRQVTTHWRFAPSLAREFPSVRVNRAASFLKDGPYYSSGGGISAIEMTLSLIEEDYGKTVALSVARELVVDLRPPGDEGISDPDPYQYELDPAERLADLPAWIAAHLRNNLSVDALATRTSLCTRHFSRMFKQIYHVTPATFVEQMRLNEARRRLLSSRNSIATVAASVGFKSSDAFRRAFERRYGVTPREFRTQRSSHSVAGEAD